MSRTKRYIPDWVKRLEKASRLYKRAIRGADGTLLKEKIGSCFVDSEGNFRLNKWDDVGTKTNHANKQRRASAKKQIKQGLSDL